MHSDFEILNLWTQGEEQLNQGIQKLDVLGGATFSEGGPPPQLWLGYCTVFPKAIEYY